MATRKHRTIRDDQALWIEEYLLNHASFGQEKRDELIEERQGVDALRLQEDRRPQA